MESSILRVWYDKNPYYFYRDAVDSSASVLPALED